MSKEDIKLIIKQYLAKIGDESMIFEDPDDNTIRALFDADELISFKYEVPGWNHSGIQLDPTGKKKYRIEFIKI